MDGIDINGLLGKPLREINKDFDTRLFDLAAQMRKHAAAQLRAKGKKAWKGYNVSNSILRPVLDRTPFPDTEAVLKFNLAVTDHACSSVLSGNMPLLEKIGTYAYVVELGAREFQAPDSEETIYKNLSAAKEKGFFFTPPSLAVRMTVSSITNSKSAETVLDPAAGAGVLLACHIILNPHLKCAAGIEIDAQTSKLAEELLAHVCSAVGKNVNVRIVCSNFFDYFENVKGHPQADLIVMNPPYGAVKVLASDLTDASTQAIMSEADKAELEKSLKEKTIAYAARLRDQFSAYGVGKGTLESSKLFMAAALELISPQGALVAITPSAWLGDETSSDFRKNIIAHGWLHEVWLIPERAELFKGVNQPTAVSILRKEKAERVRVRNAILSAQDIEKLPDTFTLRSIAAISGEKMKFPQCGEKSMRILTRLRQYGKMRDAAGLVNARGELDLTAHKKYVSIAKTGNRLVRGDHIQGSVLGPAEASAKAGYVAFDDFLRAIQPSGKAKYIHMPRIAIPQCSYLQKKKRIEAAIVPQECVIANSCDFLAVKDDRGSLEPLLYYWMVMGSSVVEWQFRVFSYNNHIANKEIGELACVPYEELSEEGKAFLKRSLQERGLYSEFTAQQDAFIASVYKLTLEEYAAVLRACGVEESTAYLQEYKKINADHRAAISQHRIPSLSELDKLMISYVEPGGNWTSIPESVPSKRLEQIRKMAKTRGMVRTTYYGRLKYDQPAYTISTYFNRPGNGANIHPWEDRTLSPREAARLQSFPDSFIFEGSDAEVRTQIGNAVPPLLGYAIGTAIKRKAGQALQFCDIFAGAGGLSFGLELAGYKGVAALELNEAAAATFTKNHSEVIDTIIGDINDEEIQDALYKTIKKEISPDTPWVLAGGPPCQGFSTAGYRDENDIRNRLVDSYLKIIQTAQPAIVVMENVPGILSMKKGNVIKGVYQSLRRLGYVFCPDPWVLDAERYGVPQMRKRVIIVAAKEKKYLPDYPTPLFDKCLGRREQAAAQISPDSLSYPITVGEALYGLPPLMAANRYYPSGAAIDDTYSRWCGGEITAEELLKQRGQQNYAGE